ncbi:chaperonin-like RbcX protein 2, chloroplastic [Coffea eugenioides]|uniref:chaperonin-like RbcX protein 2, chloroplastic n=1 Tax=Coffea eugenioides TaxID=49369 RepID=UPI000F610A09|nr:chaperonin-like RbcX protein 2, chloroplastic [Coffea eugenioides]
MVGPLSLVASPITDSHGCPRLCLDALPSCNLSSGDLITSRNLVTSRRHMPRPTGSLELSSPFLDSVKALSGGKSLREQRENRSLKIVSEVAGQYEENFADVKASILNFFTYKAVRTVMNQLSEMNPPQYRWFNDYVAANKPRDGKRFIRSLAKEKRELAERVMVTRLYLYGKWIKKCDHAAIYKEISDQNLELMRERLIETVIWPSDDTNTEKIG